MRAKLAVALLPVVSSKRHRSGQQEPDEEICPEERNSNTSYSEAGSSDISSDFKHRANSARDGS